MSHFGFPFEDSTRHVALRHRIRLDIGCGWSVVRGMRNALKRPIQPVSQEAIVAEISRLSRLPLSELRAAWRTEFRKPPPKSLWRDLLLRTLAWRIQETRIPEEFWTSTWKIKELDTSSGRQILLETLASIDANVRFERPWHEGIAIVDAPNLKDQHKASKPKTKKATKKKKS